MYFLNIAFHIIHIAIIVFCLLGWLVPELLIYHFILCCLTLFSWFVIGFAVRRPGLCVVTAIQQKMRKKIEAKEEIKNYVHFLVKKITGKDINPKTVDCFTQISLYSLTILSFYLNFF